MFCCDMMKEKVFYTNDSRLDENRIIFYSKRFDEYMIPILLGDCTSGICITYCPWCGTKLPESKRQRWFDELEKMGIEFSLFDTEQIPPSYLSDDWWKNDIEDGE